MRRKVLFVITKSNWGGAQRYVYDLATSPVPGFDVVVAAGGAGALVGKLEAAGVRTVSIGALGRDVRLLKDISAFFELYRLIRRERPDVVHLNSSKAGAMGALAARLALVPRIIFTAHGWFHNEERSVLVRGAVWLLHGLTQLLAHETIAVSNAIIRTAPIPSRTTLIHNGIRDTPLLPQSEARVLLTLKGAQFIEGVPALGTIGELHNNKGHDILIHALAQVTAPLTCTIIGEGEERAKTTQLLAERKLTNVSLVGHIDNAATVLSAFDIFVLPSRTEAFAYVLLEAGLAGLPVIASNVGGVPEVIAHDKTGILVPANDPSALAAAISNLLAHRERVTTLGRALHARVREEFLIDTMAEKTYAVYSP